MADREKIAELLKLPHCNATSIEACCGCEYGEITDCYMERLLDHLLANGVTVQKHGRWIVQDEGRTRFMCSNCEKGNYGGYERYCPYCGAKMEE